VSDEGPTRAAPSAASEAGTGVRLDSESVEAIARRVAELLAMRPELSAATPPRRLLTAAEVSEWWGVERSWVYSHAAELGARRLGTGQRPRLRFDPDEVAQRLAALSAAQAGGPRSSQIPADSGAARFRARAELWSPGKRSRPGRAATPPATAPRSRPSAR
jgi:hypothetical protein